MGSSAVRSEGVGLADCGHMSSSPYKWFDRSLPQTLQSAVILLYIHVVFALIGGAYSYFPWGLLITVLSFIGAFGMSNEKRVGYYSGIAAAIMPFFLRFFVWDGPGISVMDRLTGNNIINMIFEVALVALLVHPMSRSYQRIWFK
jgi:hypothetical protein